MMTLHEIIEKNQGFLKGTPDVYFSPGRVNLIGEHIDYLGGSVFPAAINLGTYGFVTKREDKELHFLSENFKERGVITTSLQGIVYKKEDNWTNYCKGMFKFFQDKGVTFEHGYNILIYGTLPNGAGLSSSASLEVLIGEIINDQLNLNEEMVKIVQMAQKVENNFVGVNCGIMDQFAVGMGKENSAIHLNTNTLDYKIVPLELGDYTLLIANTNKRRSLTESAYNERRSQCDQGLETLQNNGVKIKELCDLTPNEFESVRQYLTDPIISNRVEHAVYENNRVESAVTNLQKGDILRFGELMTQSHDSCRDLFEISCHELNVLVDSFIDNGAIGARMTGAGFGGCAIALVPTEKVDDIVRIVQETYRRIVGYNADFYPVKTSNGTSKIEVKKQ
jgi:galactokinase